MNITGQSQRVGRESSFVRRLLFGTAAIAIGGLTAAPALAQLEEIVVTARKTEENLRDVPLQVTAVTIGLIKDQNMTTPRDLNTLSPGLNWQSNTGGRLGAGRLFFRGLAAGLRNDGKGSVFLDGNYLASSSWDIPFHYYQRVEVMPGPQSAVFGRATFGGGINNVTKDPGTTFGGEANINVMTLGQKEVDVFVGGPLVGDKLLGSAFASYQDFNGPDSWRSPPDVLHPTGVQVSGTTTYFGAVKLAFQPSDTLSAKVHVMHTYDHDDPGVNPWPNYAELNGRFTKPNGVVVRYPVGPSFHIETYPGGFPTLAHNYYNIADPSRRTESWRTAAELSWDVGEHNVAVQAYREFEWSKTGGWDNDFTTFPALHSSPQWQTVKAYSGELRITSPEKQRFRYSFGAYYLNLVTLARSTTFFDFSCQTVCEPQSAAALFNPAANFNPATSSIAGYNGVITRNTTAPTVTNSRNLIRDKSVFATFDFDLTEKLTLRGEGRYQWELIDTQNYVAGGFYGNHTYKKFLPRVTLDYKFSDAGHVYALYSIGNNPGGFNTSIFVGLPGSGTTPADRTIPEETLYNYEIGLKSEFFDGMASIDLAVYHMDWKNQVQSVTNLQPGSTTASYAILSGAGNSKVDGIGISLNASPIEGLTLNSNISYNRSIYTRYCSNTLFSLLGLASPGQLGCVIINGNRMETVPPWMGSLNVGYTRPLMGDWNWKFYGSFQYQDGQFESNMNLASSEPMYLWNFSIGIVRDNFNFDLYCTNCSQEETPYRFSVTGDARFGPNGTLNASVTATPRRPRQFGFKTGYKF